MTAAKNLDEVLAVTEILEGKPKKKRRKKTGRPRLIESATCVRVGFSIPKDLWRDFITACEELNMSKSEYFRALIAKGRKPS